MASKPIRYKDGTLLMPGSDAHEMHTLGKHKELEKHMKQLEKNKRELESRDPNKAPPIQDEAS